MSTGPVGGTSPFGRGLPGGGGGARRGLPKWAIPVGIVVGLLLLVVLPLMGSYNGLVDKDEKVKTEFANVDTQLQRRYDLLPNLVEGVRAALRQEQAVFGEIARARTQYGGARSPSEKAEASAGLESAISRLLVIVESFPVLRSNDTIRDLQVQLEGTENRVAQARRSYNETVRDYNTAIRRFPRSLIAGMFGFDRAELFEAEPGGRQAPRVDLGVTPTPAPSAS